MSLGMAQDGFLNDIEALAMGSGSVDNAARKHRTNHSRQSDRLQAARDEIASLLRQIECIQENHEVTEALDRLLDRSSDDIHKWKFRAMRERSQAFEAK